ncbi:MAG: diguanylate cyclase [Rhodospirillales bacterium]|nr:diguanylate cyclase [Rhodospirillales bacterium]
MLFLLVGGAIVSRMETIQAAEVHLRDMAGLLSGEQSSVISQAGNTLRVLGDLTSVRMLEPSCQSTLARIAGADPEIDGIAVLDGAGIVRCFSEGIAPGISLADRPYFRQALTGDGATVATGLVVSRLQSKPRVVVAVPVPGDAPARVVAASLTLDRIAGLLVRAPQGAGAIGLIVNPANASVLAASPEGESRTPVSAGIAQALAAAFRESPTAGTATVTDDAGMSRVVGFAPIEIGDNTLLIAAAVPHRTLVGHANRRLYLAIGFSFFITIVILVAAWSAARSVLLRPIAALGDAAQRLGTGDLTARARVPGATRELRILALAFNRMGRQLGIRDRQLSEALRALHVSEERHRLLADNATDMITLFDRDFQRTYVSPACKDVLGYTQTELLGRNPQEIVHEDDLAIMEAQLHGPLRAGQATALSTFRTRHKDGTYRWLEVSGRRLPDGGGFVVVTRDVTRRKTVEQALEAANRQLEALAMEDPLTGLANRRRFDFLLDKEWRRSCRRNLPLSVVMLDADWFKQYNDTFGHPAGDVCLQGIASAIEGVLRRPADLAARYGGEEFVVMLPDTDHAGARHMAERIRAAVRALAKPHPESPYGIVTVSLGVATAWPLPNGEPGGQGALVSAADHALYEAKASGRNVARATELGLVPQTGDSAEA